MYTCVLQIQGEDSNNKNEHLLHASYMKYFQELCLYKYMAMKDNTVLRVLIWSQAQTGIHVVFMIPLVEQHCVFVYFSSFFLDSNQHHATAGHIWVGWSGLANSSARYPALTSESPAVFGKTNPTQYILAHTRCLLTVTCPQWGRGWTRDKLGAIIPASMVDVARRRSLGRAAGCTAPCRAACPGCRSCSRWASDHWASDTPPGEFSFLRRTSGCTEVSKEKDVTITIINWWIFFFSPARHYFDDFLQLMTFDLTNQTNTSSLRWNKCLFVYN